MSIDFTRAITAENKAVRVSEARTIRIKAECRAHILAAVDETEQANIAQAGVIYAAMRADGVSQAKARNAVGFAKGDLETAARWKAWVNAMQSECRRAITTASNPTWPALPDGVTEMATRF